MDDIIREAPQITSQESLEKLILEPSNLPITSQSIDIEHLIQLISSKAFLGLSHSLTEPTSIIELPPPPFNIPASKSKSLPFEINTRSKPSTILRQKLVKIPRSLPTTSNITLDKKIPVSKELPHPETIFVGDSLPKEQLSDLFTVLEMHRPALSMETTKQIHHFAKLLKICDEKNAEEHLGKLIYLISYLPREKIGRMKIKSCEQLIKWIELHFHEKIQAELEHLLKTKEQSSLSGLKDSNVGIRHQYALFLANLLLSKSGTVNFGVISPFLRNYPPEKFLTLSPGDPIMHLLETLAENGPLCRQLDTLVLPQEITGPAASIIRSTLSLRLSDPITPLDAKKTILSALLSHLRQGTDGSCFAIPLAIFLLLRHPGLCLEDFSSLLKKNKLGRTFNHTSRDFPFILNTATTDLKKTLKIDLKGQMISLKGQVKLYEDPTVLALCNFLGIKKAKTALLEIVAEHKEEFQNGISFMSVIQKLVLHAKQLPEHAQHGIGELYQQCLLLFQAQTSHPLLTGWINSIANMAEPDETGMIRSTIIQAICTTLNKRIEECISDPEKSKKAVSIVKRLISERIQLQYDPGIQIEEKSSDQRSTSGAFVLYNTHSAENIEQWTRIDQPKDFCQFISHLFEKIKVTHQDDPNGELEKLWEDLQEYALTKKFLKTCVCDYYSKNKQFSDPLKQYTKMSYTPWVTKSGNSFSKVVQVYFQNFVSSNSELYSPKNPKDLFLKIVALGKGIISSTTKKNNAPYLIPVRIPNVHAFNLSISHPSMTPFLTTNNAGEWLDKQLLVPCKLLSEQIVDPLCRETFLSEVKNKIVPQEMWELFEKDFQNKNNEQLKIKELRDMVLESLKQLFRKKKLRLGELCSQLDLLLIESLPKERRQEIRSKAVHLADTNWSDGVHDIHICLLMNPGSAELDLFVGYHDNEKIFSLNTDEWINGKKWEFFIEVESSATVLDP